jgi:hypothetical protein
VSDTTHGLSSSGEVVFRDVVFGPNLELRGISGRWLAARLLTPITQSTDPVQGMVRASQLPRVTEFSADLEFEEADLPADFAFTNTAPLDCSKDFLPFGEKPKFGDTFYLSSKAFANDVCILTLQIELANPAGGGGSTPVPPVNANATKLLWEFWDGKQWQPLGTSEAGPPPATPNVRTSRVRFMDDEPAPADSAPFSDATQALSRSGTITFTMNGQQAAARINGQTGYWLRARMTAGDYGKEMKYETDGHSGKVLITPATFAPPLIHSLKVQYRVVRHALPNGLIKCNDFSWQPVPAHQEFAPFVPVAEDDLLPSVFFGFILPAAAQRAEAALVPGGAVQPSFAARTLSLYLQLHDQPETEERANSAGRAGEVPRWEYWNGDLWQRWALHDGTAGLNRSGLLSLLPPLDYKRKDEFGRSCYWLRMRQGRPDFRPRLQMALINTTLAEQGTTILNENLGVSNGRPCQMFTTIQSPVLAGQQLEVAEPVAPPQEEEQHILDDEGDDAIRKTVTGDTEQYWVRWHEVPNFNGSGPRDRHYMLNRQTGEVHFGDAVNGLIPPAFPGNIHLAKYRTGGGQQGNKHVFAISQLKSAIPYVSKAANWVPADGGGDAETIEALIDRGPRTLRHRNRAVTREDFEDLALDATGEVARARCIPLYDLEADPDTRTRKPGVISVIIAPRSTGTTPQPGTQLLAATRDYLRSSAQSTVDIVTVGPDYIAVDISVAIVVDDPSVAQSVELNVTRAMSGFLHPITGNSDGKGWDFGRMPQKSEIFKVIEDIDGVNHARNLVLTLRPLRAGTGQTSRSLACCGKLNIVTTLQNQPL